MPPTARKITPPTVNSVWASTPSATTVERITLPSGQTADVIRLGLEGLVTAGILSDTDTLTSIVDQKHVRRVRGGKKADRDELDPLSLMKDPESMKKIVLLVDRATPHIVVNPPVKLHIRDLPNGKTEMIPVEEREPGDIYTDQVGFEDKMFLFNLAVGGSADVDRFRRESQPDVAGVADVTELSRPAKRAAGRKR